MTDSEKRASTTNSKKKGSSVDETFGEDFLNSWKSSNLGKDDINFDMETVPKNKKKPFDFGKLDDFELSGGFDKISSFKIDMPDLDFSSPVKKTENPKEKSSKELIPGKQESSQEKFSFNFDFNELDRFDLDSSPRKSERNSKKLTDDTPDRSSKPNMNKNSSINSVISSDLPKDEETKNQDTDNMGAARPDSSFGPSISKASRPSTSSDIEHHDVSQEMQTSAVHQIAVAGEKNETCSIEQYNEQSRETCLKKRCDEEATEDLPPQPLYGDSSAQEDNSRIRTGIGCLESLDAVNPHSAREHDDGMRSVDSSQSRNTSPTNSFNSRSCAKTLVTNSSNTSGDSQKHHQGNEFEITGGKAVPSELNPGHKNIENVPLSEFSKITSEMKNSGKKETSGLKLLPSSLQRDSVTVRSICMMENPTGAEQFKAVNKLAENASQTSSAFAQKKLDNVHNSKMKKINTCFGNDKGEPKKNYEQAKNQKLGILKSYENGSARSLMAFSGSEKNGKSSDTSSFQLKSSSLPWNTASNTTKSIIPNFLSSIASTKAFKTSPVEKIGTYKDDKACDISRLSISRITNLNSKSENSETDRGPKLARFSEKASKLPMSGASNMANPIVKEKCPLLGTSLKRKTSEFQESPPDPETINPLKRAMGSAIGRKLFEISSNFQRTVVTKAPLTEITEVCNSDNSPRHLTSSHVPEFGSITDTEVPKDDKACDLSRLTISSQSPSCGTPREAKPESLAGQKILSPSNRAIKSATKSKLFDISPRTQRAMVLLNEKPEACQSKNRAQNLISNGASELGSLVEVEVPVLIEKDENVEKAEAWAKELNDMCGTLKKQHEEAKELLVRTLVTNNQLLMLNHPMLEEKINSLQRFANSLGSREI